MGAAPSSPLVDGARHPIPPLHKPNSGNHSRDGGQYTHRGAAAGSKPQSLVTPSTTREQTLRFNLNHQIEFQAQRPKRWGFIKANGFGSVRLFLLLKKCLASQRLASECDTQLTK